MITVLFAYYRQRKNKLVMYSYQGILYLLTQGRPREIPTLSFLYGSTVCISGQCLLVSCRKKKYISSLPPLLVSYDNDVLFTSAFPTLEMAQLDVHHKTIKLYRSHTLVRSCSIISTKYMVHNLATVPDYPQKMSVSSL